MKLSRSAASPSDVTGFDCFFVNVTGKGIPASPPACLGLGTVSPLVPLGTIEGTGAELSLSAGAQRTVQVLGVKASDGKGCSGKTYLTDFAQSTLSPSVYLVGQTTVDLLFNSQVFVPTQYQAAVSPNLLSSCSLGGPTTTTTFAVTSISPTSGGTNGGDAVTIVGSGFGSGTTVSLGGSSCVVSAVTAIAIQCLTSPHAAGVVDVTLTNASGATATLAGAFTYAISPTPRITSIFPKAGAVVGGTSVTLSGTNLSSAATVTIGGSNCTGVMLTAAGALSCVTTQGVSAGLGDVVVTNPDGQTSTLSQGYSYEIAPGPIITSISTATAPTNGSPTTAFGVIGSNFYSSSRIFFGSVECPSYVAGSSTGIGCNSIPASASAGAVDIIVQNPDNQIARVSNGFTYTLSSAPVLAGTPLISPATGSTNGGAPVSLNVSYVASNATITFGGRTATCNGSGCTTPTHPAGIVDVVVTNPDGQTVTLPGAFTYVMASAPVINTPISGSSTSNGGTSFTISGSNFANGATAKFNDGSQSYPCLTTTFVSSTTLTCLTPSYPYLNNSMTLIVTNPDGQTGSATGFVYTAASGPAVSAVSPTSVTTDGGLISLTGSNFFYMGSPQLLSPSVTVNGKACTSVTVASSSQLGCDAPANPAGSYAITVTNPDGQSGTSAPGMITYTQAPAPVIGGLSPTSGSANGGTSVTLTGSGFNNPSTVTFGGSACTITSVTAAHSVPGSSLTCATGPHPSGVVNVVVTNPDGQTTTAPGAFTYQ